LLDRTFLGLGLGKLFPVRESLVSDIPAGDGNPLNLFLQCKDKLFKRESLFKDGVMVCSLWMKVLQMCSLHVDLVLPTSPSDFFLDFISNNKIP